MVTKKLTSLIVLIVSIGLIGYVVITTKSAPVGAEEGKTAPDFQLPLWETGDYAKLSDFRGDIVVLNLWASWCPPCRKEMPALNRFAEEYKDKGVVVVGVNLSTQESSYENVEQFMNEFNVTFPTFVDLRNEEKRGIVMSLYNINSIPNTYVIDRKGKIVRIFQGEVTYDILANFVETIK